MSGEGEGLQERVELLEEQPLDKELPLTLMEGWSLLAAKVS